MVDVSVKAMFWSALCITLECQGLRACGGGEFQLYLGACCGLDPGVSVDHINLVSDPPWPRPRPQLTQAQWLILRGR